MKFHRKPRIPFNDTSRKRSFVAIKHRREREKFPLFAAEIAESQRDVDTIMTERADQWSRRDIEARHKRAVEWVNLRRMLKLLPDDERRAFLAHYYRVRYPLDPSYMRTVLRMFLDGRLLMQGGVVVAQAELDFLAERAAKILGMTDEQLLSAIQSPYANDAYRDELRAERTRRSISA